MIKVENELQTVLEQEDPETVLIAGASHLSQYPILMSAQIREHVEFVIDNSDHKANKCLYGTNFTCKKFESIQGFQKPLAIVFSSPYQNEMNEQILNLSSNALILNG